MLNFLRNLFGGGSYAHADGKSNGTKYVRASYDAAKTTDGNKRHWANADSLSADAAQNAVVRRILIRRCRYESANNAYCRGIISTVANDCVGPSGPRLRMCIDEDQTTNELIESDFAAWAMEVDLAGKLRTLRASRDDSGEGLLVAVHNPALRSPIKLDIKVVECDRLTSPLWINKQNSDRYCDGIEYDEWGNPQVYNILKNHPGSQYGVTANPTDFEPIDAKFVFHYFKPERPEQRRGIPSITPALPLFAQLRRLTLATVSAAETAASFAMVVETNGPPGEEFEVAEAFDKFELEHQMVTTLPAGYKLSQTKAEQPTTAYDSFENAILRQIGRCINVPFTIAALDSSKSNLAAAYLDHQTYAKSINVDRHQLTSGLEWLIGIWFTMARALPKYDGLEANPKHKWLWSNIGNHADPQKVASAQTSKLRSGLTDLVTEYAREGIEADDALEAQARILGLTIDELRVRLTEAIYGNPGTLAKTNDTNQPTNKEPEDEPAETE